MKQLKIINARKMTGIATEQTDITDHLGLHPYKAKLFTPASRSDLVDFLRGQKRPIPLPIRALGTNYSLSGAGVPEAESSSSEKRHGTAICTDLLNRHLNTPYPANSQGKGLRSCLPAETAASEKRISTSLEDSLLEILCPQAREQRRCFVHVEAGIKMKDLLVDLKRHGMAVPTMGAGGGQSLAGALSTATHGGDMNVPLLHDWVRGCCLITGKGETYFIFPEIFEKEHHLKQTELTYRVQNLLNDESVKVKFDNRLFAACLTSVGRLGIIYSLILEVVPAYYLAEFVETASWNEVQKIFSSYTAARSPLQFPVPPRNFDLRAESKATEEASLRAFQRTDAFCQNGPFRDDLHLLQFQRFLNKADPAGYPTNEELTDAAVIKCFRPNSQVFSTTERLSPGDRVDNKPLPPAPLCGVDESPWTGDLSKTWDRTDELCFPLHHLNLAIPLTTCPVYEGEHVARYEGDCWLTKRWKLPLPVKHFNVNYGLADKSHPTEISALLQRMPDPLQLIRNPKLISDALIADNLDFVTKLLIKDSLTEFIREVCARLEKPEPDKNANLNMTTQHGNVITAFVIAYLVGLGTAAVYYATHLLVVSKVNEQLEQAQTDARLGTLLHLVAQKMPREPNQRLLSCVLDTVLGILNDEKTLTKLVETLSKSLGDLRNTSKQLADTKARGIAGDAAAMRSAVLHLSKLNPKVRESMLKYGQLDIRSLVLTGQRGLLVGLADIDSKKSGWKERIIGQRLLKSMADLLQNLPDQPTRDDLGRMISRAAFSAENSTPFRMGLATDLLDTHNYRTDGLTKAQSAEFFFDAEVSDWVDFINNVLALAAKNQPAPVLGYIGVRFMPRTTKSLLAMQRFRHTVSVEITPLASDLQDPYQGFKAGVFDLATRCNAIPHWGQQFDEWSTRLSQPVPVPENGVESSIGHYLKQAYKTDSGVRGMPVDGWHDSFEIWAYAVQELDPDGYFSTAFSINHGLDSRPESYNHKLPSDKPQVGGPHGAGPP